MRYSKQLVQSRCGSTQLRPDLILTFWFPFKNESCDQILFICVHVVCVHEEVCVYACVYTHVCHICVDVRGQLSVSALLPPAGTFTSQLSQQSNPNRTFSNLLLFVCLLDFWERVSLYTSVWSVTHHSAQADLGFSILLFQPPRSWGFYSLCHTQETHCNFLTFFSWF